MRLPSSRRRRNGAPRQAWRTDEAFMRGGTPRLGEVKVLVASIGVESYQAVTRAVAVGDVGQVAEVDPGLGGETVPVWVLPPCLARG